MVHFKSYGAVQKFTDTGETVEYRRGFIMWPRSHTDDGIRYFEELNDGLVEELTMRWFRSQWENPLFKKELEGTHEICANNILNKKGFLSHEVCDIWHIKKENRFDWMPFKHISARLAIGDMRKAIFLSCDRATINGVLDILVRPMFTGHLFEISRIIDSTPNKDRHLTKGNLRKIATPD
jgi:hypothetical protein